MFKMEFSTDNSAFAEEGHLEAARILEIVAQGLRVEDFGGCIFDVNGNKIGYFYMEIDND